MSRPKKILMVAIPSLHFFRWTEQLKGSGFEVYWFDVTGSGKHSNRIEWVYQKIDWRLKWDFMGRHILKKKFPKFYQNIQKINERSVSKAFEEYLLEVQPDIVHSFALYVACAPILEVMERYNRVPWIYSSWGSDLFYFQNFPEYLKDIKKVLPRIDFLFTDCNRDYEIAKKYGFEGEFLGVFPGGGGFDFGFMEQKMLPVEKRKTILIKGFQGRSGRAITVLEVIEQQRPLLKVFEIIVFGADDEVLDYCRKSELHTWSNFSVFGKVNHEFVLQLMGQALIYVGNSNSDGVPNTLLEATCFGAFPIQSNPGGATAEVIANNKNGLLINDCDNPNEIMTLIDEAIKNKDLINNGFTINQEKIRPNYERGLVAKKVLKKYNSIIN